MYKEIIDHLLKEIQLSTREQEEFISILSEVRIPKKEFLIVAGEPVSAEYYVVRGCLIAYYLDEKGARHILQFAVEDWWISDFEAFFDGTPSQLYVESLEDSVLLEIKKDALEELYYRIPAFERFFRIKITSAFVALRSRVLSSLQKSGRQRYLEFCEVYPEIEKRVPNSHIANYLGLKPESLSRIRKEL